MKNRNYIRFILAFILLIGSFIYGCGQQKAQNNAHNPMHNIATINKTDSVKYKVTFIELGSVRCKPCQQMQPVMKSIEEKYPDQVNVIFHDIWTPLGKPMADKFNIQIIPTQVFLDENGVEFFRHEGYFAEGDLVKVLQTKGVN